MQQTHFGNSLKNTTAFAWNYANKTEKEIVVSVLYKPQISSCGSRQQSGCPNIRQLEHNPQLLLVESHLVAKQWSTKPKKP